jgi:hypothetical protein
MRQGILLGIALSIVTVGCAEAQDDWSVVFNGRAIHMNASQEWNEENWGLGFEKEFDSDRRWVKVAVGNAFQDSLGEPSYMAGGGLKRRFRLNTPHDELYVDFGLVGFLMTREDVNNNRPFPGILPAITVGTRQAAVNVSYLPESVVDRTTRAYLRDPDLRGILFIQLRLDPRLLRPR